MKNRNSTFWIVTPHLYEYTRIKNVFKWSVQSECVQSYRIMLVMNNIVRWNVSLCKGWSYMMDMESRSWTAGFLHWKRASPWYGLKSVYIYVRCIAANSIWFENIVNQRMPWTRRFRNVYCKLLLFTIILNWKNNIIWSVFVHVFALRASLQVNCSRCNKYHFNILRRINILLIQRVHVRQSCSIIACYNNNRIIMWLI